MTRTGILVLGLLLFVNSCRPLPQATKVALVRKSLPITQGFAVVDSLAKYQSANSLLLVDSSTRTLLRMGKAGAARYAIWLIDSTLVFYQQLPNQKWLACDTLNYLLDFSFAQSMDLNADGIEDVRVSSISGSADNTENAVFLFDSKQVRFRHNGYYDLPNVELDQQHKFIKSWWYAGVVHCQEKQKYQITGDSLTLNSEITYCPDEKTPVRTGTLTASTYANGKLVSTEKRSGKPGKLWQAFKHTLWDSSRR